MHPTAKVKTSHFWFQLSDEINISHSWLQPLNEVKVQSIAFTPKTGKVRNMLFAAIKKWRRKKMKRYILSEKTMTCKKWNHSRFKNLNFHFNFVSSILRQVSMIYKFPSIIEVPGLHKPGQKNKFGETIKKSVLISMF